MAGGRCVRRQRSQGASLLSSALIWLIILIFASPLPAEELHVSGQFSTWGQVDPDDPSEGMAGLRYIPEISTYRQISETWELGAEAALNLYGQESWGTAGDGDWDGDLYRLWIRFASPQLEIRGGLQKISFGAAALLRPLMWFDTLDPRDPLGLTRGVYGLMARYTFLDNANLWLWGLYGNDRLRGWQALPSEDDGIEFGGRYQFPLMTGEMALSYHHRTVDPESIYPGLKAFTEESFGLDGKWDAGIGIWFEGSLTHRKWDIAQPAYLSLLTVGADTTLDVGNGLHILAEHLFIREADGAFDPGESAAYTALAADYTLNLFDSLYAILTYDHDNDDLSSFLQWHRTYDNWQIFVSLFHNTEGNRAIRERGGYESLTGDGLRVMAVFNH